MKRRSFLAALFAAPTVAVASSHQCRVIAPPAKNGLAMGRLSNPSPEPFLVDSAHVRMNCAEIGAVSAGRISSRDRRMVIDFGSGVLRIAA